MVSTAMRGAAGGGQPAAANRPFYGISGMAYLEPICITTSFLGFKAVVLGHAT